MMGILLQPCSPYSLFLWDPIILCLVMICLVFTGPLSCCSSSCSLCWWDRLCHNQPVLLGSITCTILVPEDDFNNDSGMCGAQLKKSSVIKGRVSGVDKLIGYHLPETSTPSGLPPPSSFSLPSHHHPYFPMPSHSVFLPTPPPLPTSSSRLARNVDLHTISQFNNNAHRPANLWAVKTSCSSGLPVHPD